MIEELVAFILDQVFLVPLLVYALWLKYKTGKFFPYDDENVKTPMLVWFLGIVIFGLLSALSFFLSMKIYGILFSVLMLSYLIGIIKVKIGEKL